MRALVVTVLRGIRNYMALLWWVLFGWGLLMLFAGFLRPFPFWEVGPGYYRDEAMVAATPREFAAAVTKLDKFLTDAGMVSGTTLPWPIANKRPNDSMEFVHSRLQALILAAEQHGATSTDVNTGLPNLRATLDNLAIPASGFWLFSQGGIWQALYIPVLLMFGSIGLRLITDALLHRTILRLSRGHPSLA